MDEETSNFEDEREDGIDIDKLLNEEEDSPIDEDITVTEESSKKGGKKVKQKGTTKKNDMSEGSAEIAKVNKELSDMEWQPYSQPAYEGLQNIKTGEVIDEREAIRRALCYAQEAARNSR